MENVVITGGCGILGRALIDRLHVTHNLTVFSRSEKGQLVLRARYPEVEFLLGDVRDASFLARVLENQDAVIHAAALKHVDLSEREPTEYADVNVNGSLQVARIAAARGISMVGVSTDKACQPLNLYGLSKLIMERVFSEHGFTSVRYGNVFASDGSVVRRWQQQLRRCGTIQVTDPEMTRFFFRVEDAVEEVLWGLWSPDTVGAVVVPRLRSVTLPDLARAVIQHHGSGEFEVTGPRPGEKRHESLLSAEEAQRSTVEEGRVLLWPSSLPHPQCEPVQPMSSDSAERIPVEELVSWLG